MEDRVEVVAEFDAILDHELDLMRETANASQLRRNFAGSKVLQIPEMIWPLCASNVLVMERMERIPVLTSRLISASSVRCPTSTKTIWRRIFWRFLSGITAALPACMSNPGGRRPIRALKNLKVQSAPSANLISTGR